MGRLVRTHRRIVRREARGVGPSIVRGLLRAAAFPYEVVVRARNAAYDAGVLRSYGCALPVVGVGNLTAGGVGKTPFVETVVRWLEEAGRIPVVVSRGYKGVGGLNDEALLLKSNMPNTPHLQNPDRVAAVNDAAVRRLGDVVVLDDGFQHRRLRRTVDVVLLDATDPFGGGRLLPAGFLREPIGGLARADAVVVTRASLVSSVDRASIREQVRAVAPHSVLAEIDFEPSSWRRLGSIDEPLERLRGRRVLAFCGVGNPEAFQATLERIGVDVVAFEPFADHHWYDDADLARLSEKAKASGADALVATQKDAVKIPAASIGGLPLHVLTIHTAFQSGEFDLRQLVFDRVAAFRPT
jgi:tetraacyldisaccharide 4'-kinase